MTFENLVSKLYDTYTHSLDKPYYAKILVGNEYVSFDDYNINEFLKIGVNIHELNIQTMSMREKIVTPDTYKRHKISNRKLFVKVKGMFNDIKMILPNTKVKTTYEEQPTIIQTQYQIV